MDGHMGDESPGVWAQQISELRWAARPGALWYLVLKFQIAGHVSAYIYNLNVCNLKVNKNTVLNYIGTVRDLWV